MLACIHKLLERLGIIDHVDDTGWNAHGNTATGDATNFLKVEDAALLIEGSTPATPIGDTPTTGAGTRFQFVPGKDGSLCAGKVTGTEWDSLPLSSIAAGIDSGFGSATGKGHICMGSGCTVTSNFADGLIAMGDRCDVTSNGVAVAIGGLSSVNNLLGGVAIGSDVDVTNNFSAGLGSSIDVTGSSSVGIGPNVTVSGNGAVAVGQNTTASNTNTVAIGNSVEATAANAVCIGSGASSFNTLVNNKANSIFMGVGSTIPTFILDAKTTGVGTTGFIGIVEQNPLSTLDIGGSVGYGYSILSQGDHPHTVGSADNELVFIVKATTTFDFNLPAISGIERRMYHVRNASTNGAVVHVHPDSGGDLMDKANGSAPTTVEYSLDPGESIQIVADSQSATDTWWVI